MTSPAANATTHTAPRVGANRTGRRGIGWLLAILLVAAMAVTPWVIAVIVSTGH